MDEQGKSAVKVYRCGANRTAGVNQKLKCTGLNEDVITRSQLENGSNKRQFGSSLMCWWNVIVVKFKDKVFGTQGMN